MRTQRSAFLGIMAAVLLICCRGKNVIPAVAQAEISETKYVALTFDDGPRACTTGRLLDGLRERGASATFFLIGRQIAGNEDLVCRMKDEGHQIGNHTWDHVKLQGMPAAVVSEEISRTDDAIRDILGDGTYWVRPPYGLLNKNQLCCFSTPLVHWSVDPEDWKLRNTKRVTAAVLKKVQPGDIILLHDFYQTSVDAALQIVDTMEDEGYEFVTVEELLALYGVTPQTGRFYTDAREKTG